MPLGQSDSVVVVRQSWAAARRSAASRRTRKAWTAGPVGIQPRRLGRPVEAPQLLDQPCQERIARSGRWRDQLESGEANFRGEAVVNSERGDSMVSQDPSPSRRCRRHPQHLRVTMTEARVRTFENYQSSVVEVFFFCCIALCRVCQGRSRSRFFFVRDQCRFEACGSRAAQACWSHWRVLARASVRSVWLTSLWVESGSTAPVTPEGF